MKTQAKSIGLIMLFSLVLLGGCGQKGPLYLPNGEEQKNAQQR